MKNGILLLGALVAVTACGGGDPDDSPAILPPTFTDDDETADTAQGPQFNTVDEIRFISYIAWDDVLQEVVSPIIDGSDTFISAYTVRIGTSAYDSNNESTFCEVTVNLQGYTGIADPAQDGYIWGIDIPQGDPVEAFEDCIEKGWDPAEFEDDSPLMDWALYDYHMRLGGDLSEDLEEWLTPDTTDPDFSIDKYVGGTWWTDTAGLTGGDDDIYFYGYEMDSDHNVDFDTELDRYEMLTPDTTLRSGYYIARMSVYWNFADN